MTFSQRPSSPIASNSLSRPTTVSQQHLHLALLLPALTDVIVTSSKWCKVKQSRRRRKWNREKKHKFEIKQRLERIIMSSMRRTHYTTFTYPQTQTYYMLYTLHKWHAIKYYYDRKCHVFHHLQNVYYAFAFQFLSRFFFVRLHRVHCRVYDKHCPHTCRPSPGFHTLICRRTHTISLSAHRCVRAKR